MGNILAVLAAAGLGILLGVSNVHAGFNDIHQVPEPGTLVLLAAGGGVAWWLGKRRR